MTQQLHSYSGQSYDRWVERNSNNSALGKVQKQFWFTKSAVIRKLGKKEDAHVVASDAELDAKIELFKAIESSTKDLQVLLADYQNKICVMAQEENALGRLLKEYGKQDRSRAGKMMTATGKSLSYTAQQRVALRNPLVRLFQEVDTFHTRAVEDTLVTVTEMEKVRTDYRGALMWMKNISQDFNPDQYHQLEKFREVQATVKQKKAKFDRLKLKSLQKVDLLAASRCNMFSHALILYQNNLITFSDKTSKTLTNVGNNFKGYQAYDFQVIKELAEPQRKVEEEQKDEESERLDEDDSTFFNAEYHDSPEKKQKARERRGSKKGNKNVNGEKKSDSLINLLDCTESENGEQLIPLGQADSNKEQEDTANSSNPQIMDFLTNNPEVPDTEKDTQQMLKELFDSPVRQQLPVFGSLEIVNSEARTPIKSGDSTGLAQGLEELENDPFAMLQSAPSQQMNMFLPSQLLDFGKQSWQSGQQAGPMSFPSQATMSHPGQGSARNFSPAGSLPQQKRQSANGATSASGTTSGPGLKQEVNKLDWYKVFQDIDPLADPASAIFSQVSDDDKKC